MEFPDLRNIYQVCCAILYGILFEMIAAVTAAAAALRIHKSPNSPGCQCFTYCGLFIISIVRGQVVVQYSWQKIEVLNVDFFQ
jgi:hypothetical protein